MAQSRPETQSSISELESISNLENLSDEYQLAEEAVQYAHDLIKNSNTYYTYLEKKGLKVHSGSLQNTKVQVLSMRFASLNDEESLIHLFRVPDFTQYSFYRMKKTVKMIKRYFEYEVGNCFENAQLIANFYYHLDTPSAFISFTNGDHIFTFVNLVNPKASTLGLGIDAWWITNPVYDFSEANLSQYSALTNNSQPIWTISHKIDVDDDLDQSYQCSLEYLKIIKNTILEFSFPHQSDLLILINAQIKEIEDEISNFDECASMGIENKLYQRIKLIIKQSLCYAKDNQCESVFIKSLVSKRMDVLDELFKRFPYIKEDTLFHILAFCSEAIASQYMERYQAELNNGLLEKKNCYKNLLQIYALYQHENQFLLLLKTLNTKVVNDLIGEKKPTDAENIFNILIAKGYKSAFTLLLHKIDKKNIENYLSDKKFLAKTYENLGPGSILQLFSKLYANDSNKLILNKSDFIEFLATGGNFDLQTEKKLMNYFHRVKVLVTHGFSFSLLTQLNYQSLSHMLRLIESDKENIKSPKAIQSILDVHVKIDFFLNFGFNFKSIIANNYAAIELTQVLRQHYHQISALKSAGWDFSKYTSEDISLFLKHFSVIGDLQSEGYFLHKNSGLTNNVATFFTSLTKVNQENCKIANGFERDFPGTLTNLFAVGITNNYIQDFKHSETLRLVLESALLIKEKISQLPKHQHQKFRAILLNMTPTEFLECYINNSFVSMLKKPPYLQPINPGIYSYKK